MLDYLEHMGHSVTFKEINLGHCESCGYFFKVYQTCIYYTNVNYLMLKVVGFPIPLYEYYNVNCPTQKTLTCSELTIKDIIK